MIPSRNNRKRHILSYVDSADQTNVEPECCPPKKIYDPTFTSALDSLEASFSTDLSIAVPSTFTKLSRPTLNMSAARQEGIKKLVIKSIESMRKEAQEGRRIILNPNYELNTVTKPITSIQSEADPYTTQEASSESSNGGRIQDEISDADYINQQRASDERLTRSADLFDTIFMTLNNNMTIVEEKNEDLTNLAKNKRKSGKTCNNASKDHRSNLPSTSSHIQINTKNNTTSSSYTRLGNLLQTLDNSITVLEDQFEDLANLAEKERISGKTPKNASMYHRRILRNTKNDTISYPCAHLHNLNMIVIGPNGTVVPSDEYFKIDWKSTTVSLATRKLIGEIFDRETLATHFLLDGTSYGGHGFDEINMKFLSPAQVSDVVYIVTKYLKDATEKDIYTTIKQKCSEQKYLLLKNERKRRSDEYQAFVDLDDFQYV